MYSSVIVSKYTFQSRLTSQTISEFPENLLNRAIASSMAVDEPYSYGGVYCGIYRSADSHRTTFT